MRIKALCLTAATSFVMFTGLNGARWTPLTLNIRVDHSIVCFNVEVIPRTTTIATYHADEAAPKPYFHPLVAKGADGELLSLARAFPMEKDVAGESKDHGHHRGIWFCHGDVIAEGFPKPLPLPQVDGVDFWSEGVGRGTLVCSTIGKPTRNLVYPSIQTANEWRAPDGTVLLREDRQFQFTAAAVGYLLVVDTTLTATDRGITFGDTKEGSFAVRVNDQFCEKNGGLIRNSNGKQKEKECWGQKADWCDYSGKVNGKPAGITIFDHPDNSSRACWHVRAYGLMAANPFGRQKSGFPAMKGRADLVKLKPGESLRLRYGVLLYAGELKHEQIQKEYQGFVELIQK